MEDNCNFNQSFYNPETELDEKHSNEIHMHKIMRSVKKSTIIIQGLIFKTSEENKKFIKLISDKFGCNGCHKIMNEYDNKNKVFVFTGDKRDSIKEILINIYSKDDEFIKYHG